MVVDKSVGLKAHFTRHVVKAGVPLEELGKLDLQCEQTLNVWMSVHREHYW